MTESFFRRNQNSIQLEVEVKSAATREITSSGTMSDNTLPSPRLAPIQALCATLLQVLRQNVSL
jgi:hypothetical protein